MLLKLEGIRKCFPGVVALDEVNFDLQEGEVHALVGENGAGKSTLMKLLSGVYPSGCYEGRILMEGEEVHFRSLKDARQAGIAIVHQELALVQELSVLDNLFLGAEPSFRLGALNRKQQRSKAERFLKALDLTFPLEELVRQLSIGKQQRLEIARALLHEPQVLILDEPTSALPEDDAAQLLQWIRDVANRGTACVYISHRMEEIYSIADRITVLRDGCSVWTRQRVAVDQEQVISAMVDRPPSDLYAHTPLQSDTVSVQVRDLQVMRKNRVLLQLPELTLHQGEIVGLAGLMGAGRSCLLQVLCGAAHAGTVVKGEWHLGDGKWKPLPSTPAEARQVGLFLIPEDRKQQALFLEEDLTTNMTCASVSEFKQTCWMDTPGMVAASEKQMQEFNVKAPHTGTGVKTLSGGNQQKVLMGRAALVTPRVLLLDEPTRGIDIGAKNEIYRRMEAWTQAGWTILWASSELQELLGLSDRLLVLNQGVAVESFSERPFDEQAVMTAATMEPSLHT